MHDPKSIFNYGPLRSLLDSNDMNEIMVNSWNKIFVEHKGVLVQTASRFIDARDLQDLIFAILVHDKKDINSALCFDGILPEGHRYNITLPPLTPHSPTLTIRKFAKNIFTLNDLLDLNFLTEKAAAFVKAAVEARLNIIISGGTGSGKTSFLNTLSSLIPESERVVSIEDTPELQPKHPNWIQLVSQKKSQQSISTKDCLINSLRMRPDRIIVGECRGSEAYDMLQAMNTGHEGSITTLHANSAIDCLSRLESLIILGQPEMPVKFVRQQMSQALDLVIQIKRLPTGERKAVEILELTGLQSDVISRSNIFELNKAGQLDVTGYVPRCLSKMTSAKTVIKSNLFDPLVKTKIAI